MSQLEIEKSLTELNNLVLNGKMMDAFEKYYHDEVIMQDNDLPPTVGKEANRLREKKFLLDITDFRNIEVKGVAAGDGISSVVWRFDYTHKDWGVRNYSQVSVQHWKDGKIIHERFVYDN